MGKDTNRGGFPGKMSLGSLETIANIGTHWT